MPPVALRDRNCSPVAAVGAKHSRKKAALLAAFLQVDDKGTRPGYLGKLHPQPAFSRESLAGWR
jgi:hypothetical protein